MRFCTWSHSLSLALFLAPLALAQKPTPIGPRADGFHVPQRLYGGGQLAGYWSSLSSTVADGAAECALPGLVYPFHMMTNSGNCPTIDIDGINGHPAINFSGAQWLTAGDQSEFRLTIPFTVAAVVDWNAASTNSELIIARAPETGGGQWFVGRYGLSTVVPYGGVSSAQVTGTRKYWRLAADPSVLVWVVTGPDASHISGMTAYKNGALWETDSITSTAYTPGAGALNLGRSSSNFPNWSRAKVGSIAVWSGAATASEALLISQAMARSFGLPLWNHTDRPSQYSASHAANPIPLSSPDDGDDLCQPSEVDTCTDPPTCSQVLGGYRYWYAMTGAIDNTVTLERTRVFASQDLVETPTLITTIARGSGCQEADPDIRFIGGKLHVVTASDCIPRGIRHYTSPNGVDWTDEGWIYTSTEYPWGPQLIHQTLKAGTSEEYALYYTRVDTYAVEVRYSATLPNPGGWSAPRQVRVNGTIGTDWVGGSGWTHHGMYYNESNGQMFDIGMVSSVSSTGLWVLTSSDGRNFVSDSALLVSAGAPAWCAYQVYRGGAILTAPNTWDLLYSCFANTTDLKIGRTTLTRIP